MSHVQGVHHIAVSVPDLDVARRFYVDLLGATEVSAVDWERGNAAINEILGLPDSAARQFIVRLGNTYIEAFEYLEPRSPPQDPDRPVNLCGYTHFAIQVDDIDAVHERMVAAGIRFHVPPPPGGPDDTDGAKTGMRATYGRDFFGNVFELIEMNRDSAIAPL
ncbi:VOC family protein [Sphingomonas sp. 1P06PA]|uniref:VOC family protein n=1 Tax=Sphingomonas sp. 1P06PA TaxID=554121 RepID=UPI0039A6B70B